MSSKENARVLAADTALACRVAVKNIRRMTAGERSDLARDLNTMATALRKVELIAQGLVFEMECASER